jgi:5-methylthioadenosine/S-adenosylhomocysteine deaminase
VVFPGLVNTHHHVGLTPVQLGITDMPLELWLSAQLYARRVDGYFDTLYSAFELIGSGVTAVQHLDTMRPAPVSAWPERGHAVIKAYLDIGLRVNYALCIRDQNRLVYAPDEQFIATLPPALARETADWPSKTTSGWRTTRPSGISTLIGRCRSPSRSTRCMECDRAFEGQVPSPYIA